MSLRVLTVCTANICRSPMMAAAFHDLGYTTGFDIGTSSAGAEARDGREVDGDTAQVATLLGFDLSKHRSRHLEAAYIDAADLIVCAASEHVQAVVELVPGAFSKTYLLLELADRATRIMPGESLIDWVARHHQGRTSMSVLRGADEYNLGDPYRQGEDRIRATLFQIVDATRTILSAWAPAPAPVPLAPPVGVPAPGWLPPRNVHPEHVA